MEHQLASKRFLKLDTVEASAMCGGSLFHGPVVRTAKAAFRLTDLEVVTAEVTCSWRFKELLHRQVQETAEHLVHGEIVAPSGEV